MSSLSFCAPSSLSARLPSLLTNGLCLVLPGLMMPVPIPIHECMILRDGRLLWGTFASPFGPSRPCIGQIPFAGWRSLFPEDQGLELLDPEGHVIATFIPHSALPLSQSRASRLRSEHIRHRQRAADDPAYASRWARQFRAALESTPPQTTQA